MPNAQPVDERLWIKEAHQLVKDLFARNPALYWIDLLASAAVAWTGTVLFFIAPGVGWQILGFVLAGVFFYRAGTFMHEIIHMPREELPWFKRAWNLFIGVPLLMPWVLYRNHIEHHSRLHFGTPRDGEYLPLASAPLRETLKYLVQIPVLPLLALARFALVGPLSWLVPPLRRWLLSNGTAYVSNPYYQKRFSEREMGHLRIVEVLCFGWVMAWLALTIAGPVELVHWLMAWALHAWTLGLNWVRNLAAHSYSNRGEPMSHLKQLEDSVNITGQTWLTVWLFPVGLRYHALHHLFPGLPYHNMGEAHRRLVTHFGPDSPYEKANYSNYFAVVATLFSSARRTSPEESAIAQWRARA
ncbi:MAG: fatty acid desaturase family protein [Wenzhouxiangella sp.]